MDDTHGGPLGFPYFEQLVTPELRALLDDLSVLIARITRLPSSLVNRIVQYTNTYANVRRVFLTSQYYNREWQIIDERWYLWNGGYGPQRQFYLPGGPVARGV